MVFYNIHRHPSEGLSKAGEIISLHSCFGEISGSGYYSAGLHPWYLDNEKTDADWESLQEVCKSENILAVGECGLDKVSNTDWLLQVKWFEKQIELANSLSKPLIIHCVRAFDEVLLMLKKSNVRVPVVFHGFNKSAELARRILAEGYYLSFGRHLIDSFAVQQVFAETPMDKLFLETDAADMDIEEVYRAAAALKEMELGKIAWLIEKNVIKVFGEKILSDHG